MRVSFHTFPSGWPFTPRSWKHAKLQKLKLNWSRALIQGIRRIGDEAFIAPRKRLADSDVAVIWGWHRPEIVKPFLASGRRVLVIERAYIQPRSEWCSLAFDGLNGRGLVPSKGDDGARWNQNFAHHLRPWRKAGGRYSLLVGQVPGDAALNGTDIVDWAQQRATGLRALGHDVVYRPHPLVSTPCPEGARLSKRSLAEDLEEADRVVCFSSTTAVESVLAGIPTVVEDAGSVAYSMASHNVADPLVRPDRSDWCHALAWRQWSMDEFQNGVAWRHLRQVLDWVPLTAESEQAFG